MKDIAKLEELPKKLGMFRSLSGVDRSWSYGHGSTDYHKVNGYFPYTHAIRIIKHYMGKSFNDAFTHFCKIVPKYQQHQFFERFKEKTYKHGRYIECYIDENGNIQSHKNLNECKGPYTFKSKDYKERWVKKIEYYTFNELLGLKHKSVWYKAPKIYNNIYEIPWRDKSIYKKEIISGEILSFDNKYDSKLIQLKSEKRQSDKKNIKELKLARKVKQYSFLTTSEKLKKASKEKDIITRDRFGFDDDSFKGEAYHGQKRKKRKNDNNTETLQSLFEIM